MSYSRLNKPSLVLPPDQRKRWRDNWGDKDLYWNQPSGKEIYMYLFVYRKKIELNDKNVFQYILIISTRLHIV